MGESKREPPSRLLGIEGMRALAASSIVVYHVWLYGAPDHRSIDFGPATKIFDNLRTGVTLFFVLSGFLLFRPFVASALRRQPSPSVRNYFLNRALRILPAYWVILLAVAILFERELWSAPGKLVANLFLAQDYVPSYVMSGIVPAWSLAIEVVFYLCVPLLGGAAIVLARRKGSPPIAAAWAPVFLMLAVGLGAKITLRLFGLGSVWQFSFLTRADWFAPGMALAVAHVLWQDGRLQLPRWWRPAALFAAAGFAVVAMKLFYGGTLSFIEYQSPMAVGCALLLALVVFAEPKSRLITLLTRKPIVAAGLGSYSLFLWHDPMVRSFRDSGITLSGRGGFLVNLAFIGAVSGIASACTYIFVEKRALAKKRAWQQRSEPVPVAAEPVGSLEQTDLLPDPTPAAPAV